MVGGQKHIHGNRERASGIHIAQAANDRREMMAEVVLSLPVPSIRAKDPQHDTSWNPRGFSNLG